MKAPLSSLNLTCPVLAAPMAGGPTTPAGPRRPRLTGRKAPISGREKALESADGIQRHAHHEAGCYNQDDPY